MIAEHEESLSSYWLLVPFKMYAYWWSFALAYFSGETPGCLPIERGCLILMLPCMQMYFIARPVLLGWVRQCLEC